MKVLLTGADGQVGFELLRALQFTREVIPTTSDGRTIRGVPTIKLDLSDSDDLQQKLINIDADVICNAAAFTAVDAAEQQAETANQINAQAVDVMAQHAAKKKALMVHYSTDYVFSGVGSVAWRESDPTEPKSIYGSSKLAGEQAIQASGCQYMIFRTAWIFSERRHNFLKTMLRLGSERNKLSVVNDQIGSPTWANTVALGTMLALNQPEAGIYHLTSSGYTSWYQFASAIMKQAHQLGLIEQLPKIEPINSEDYPTAAARPKNSSLDCHKFEATFNVKLPHWQNTLQLCMQRIKQ